MRKSLEAKAALQLTYSNTRVELSGRHPEISKVTFFSRFAATSDAALRACIRSGNAVAIASMTRCDGATVYRFAYRPRARRARRQITHLAQAGVDLPTVKRISAYKNLSMVERYSHHNGAHIQSAMDKLSQRFNAKVS